MIGPGGNRAPEFFFLWKKTKRYDRACDVVPMLAPIMIGTALSNVNEPEATRATVMEVVAVLL